MDFGMRISLTPSSLSTVSISWVNRFDELLRQGPPLGAFVLEEVEHGEQMQRQQREAAVQRVGKAETPVENGEPRLRHNRAIEFFAVARRSASASGSSGFKSGGISQIGRSYFAACVGTGSLRVRSQCIGTSRSA